ncbi:hypothetical protein JW979_16110 [bacterium]|nr:hypothetical protein [candidate division CSSED10-310 bacterium]
MHVLHLFSADGISYCECCHGRHRTIILVIAIVSNKQGCSSDRGKKHAKLQSESADPKMSFHVKDTDISDVIRMISKGHNLNIILDREITGKITLHLSDAPILEGLKTLAQSNGWELVKEGSVYRIRRPVAKKNLSYFTRRIIDC